MKKLSNFLIAVLLLAGLSVLSYPTVSNLLASRNHSRAINSYAITVESLTAREIEAQLSLAQQYNNSLSGVITGDLFDANSHAAPTDKYLSILNIGGMIGYVDIPSIQVHLPIFHTTAESVLLKGAGHLSNSALPIGGTGNHAVLTAHRGLPSAKLFTDLNKLDLGDSIYVHVLDRVLGYEVDSILVVEPHETGALEPVPSGDYLTLVTCTPYAVNSHRLLVRGRRMQLAEDELLAQISTEEQSGRSMGINIAIATAAVAIPSAGLFARRLFYSRRRNRG